MTIAADVLAVLRRHYHERPIDARARDGRFHLLIAGDEIVIARHAPAHREGEADCWLFATNHPLTTEPTAWLVPKVDVA